MLAGVVGHIKWGHYTAAAINGYNVAPLNKRRTEWSLIATVVLSDAFKMAQAGLTFVAKHAKGEWEFPITSHVRRADGQYQGRFTATLGPPVSRRK